MSSIKLVQSPSSRWMITIQLLSCADAKSIAYLHYTCVNLSAYFQIFWKFPRKAAGSLGSSGVAGVLPPPAAVSGAGLNFEQSLCTGYCGGEQVTPGGGRGNGEYHQSQPGINGEQSWRCALSALGAVTRPAASSSQPVSSASPRKCCIQSNLFPNIFHLSAKYIY